MHNINANAVNNKVLLFIIQLYPQEGTAQRFALPACGRAWKMLGSRKNPKPEKCLKMPQTPTRRVHALLGNLLADQNADRKKTTQPTRLKLYTQLNLSQLSKHGLPEF